MAVRNIVDKVGCCCKLK